MLGILALSGCATTSGLSAKSSVSTFDGTRHVTIAPHGANCGMSMVCDGIGAEWTSSDKDRAMLFFTYWGEYRSIQGARFNIDGQIIDLAPGPNYTDFQSGHTGNAALDISESTSTRGFLVPLSLVQRIEASKSVKLQLVMDNLTLDSIIIDGKTTSKAYYALGRFLAEIDKR
jgi:hypothetical protein